MCRGAREIWIVTFRARREVGGAKGNQLAQRELPWYRLVSSLQETHTPPAVELWPRYEVIKPHGRPSGQVGGGGVWRRSAAVRASVLERSRMEGLAAEVLAALRLPLRSVRSA